MVMSQLLPYKYIIDTNSILSQKEGEPYRRNVFRTLWSNIEELITDKSIVMSQENRIEVEDEDIKKWLNSLSIVVLPIDDEIQANVTKVVTTNPKLIDFKEVKSSGDAFLIATAMKYGLTVITEENKRSNKKIPYVCKNLGIPCINLLELCEKQGWSM